MQSLSLDLSNAIIDKQRWIYPYVAKHKKIMVGQTDKVSYYRLNVKSVIKEKRKRETKRELKL